MAAIRMRLRTEARSRWRAWLGLALVVALASGTAMTVFAGARRTNTAVGRFLAHVGVTHADVEADPMFFEPIAKLPRVQGASLGAFLLLQPLDPSGRPYRTVEFTANAVSRTAGNTGAMLVTRGRMFDPSDRTEAVISEAGAARGGFDVGSTLTMKAFTTDQLEAVFEGTSLPEPAGRTYAIEIVGVVRQPSDLSVAPVGKGVIYEGNASLLVSPAFFDRFRGDNGAHFQGISVRLRNGESDFSAFARDVETITNGEGAVHGGSDAINFGREAQRATQIEAFALTLFGIMIAVAALLIFAQSFGRLASLEAVDYGVLSSIGMARTQLFALGITRAAAIAIPGAAMGILVAWVCSTLMPVGLARKAEVDPGFAFDPVVFGAGAATTVIAILAAVAVPAWRASRTREALGPGRPSRVVGIVARAGASAPMVAGIRMALERGRGRAAVPVVATIAGATLALAALCAAFTYGASLHALASSAALQGWTWDAVAGSPHWDEVGEEKAPVLRAHRAVEEFSAEAMSMLDIGGIQDGVMGLQPIIGSVYPPLVRGRAPQGNDEIALGGRVLRALKKDIGDSVVVRGPEASRSMRIVGQVVISPKVLNGQIQLGGGGLVTLQAVKQMNPDESATNLFLVRFKDGVDREAAVASLQKDFPAAVLTVLAPADVANLQRVNAVPAGLAMLLVLIALATIAHALMTSIRRRRRDLAILKTIGLSRRQISATVAWQAATIAVIAVLLGAPMGISAGRIAWTAFAERIGIVPSPAVPVLLVAVILPITLATALGIGAFPAHSAARTQPALVLRSE